MNIPDSSLKGVSFLVAENLKRKESFSMQDIVNVITQILGKSNQDATLKRRVYDVVNVLAASGIVQKDGTIIKWVGRTKIDSPIVSETDISESEKTSMRVSDKIEKLKYKIEMLSLYNAIITRNSLLPRPGNALPLRFILFQADDIETERSENKLTLTIIKNTPGPPVLYTPLDVLQSIQFRFNIDQELVNKHPDLAEAVKLINEANADSDDTE